MANPFKTAVRVWLAEHDLSQSWLANEIGISSPLLSNILSGYRKPSQEVARRLRELTGIEIEPEPSEVTR